MADQVLAGSIAWSFGELPMLLVFIALGIQWAKSDQKVAARRDRQVEIYGDMELDEYNKMLNNLQKKSGQN
jgi:putative copper resistance protein D